MTIEHMFNNRPLPKLSDYRTPVKGLYLCSAGTHPGGGVIGAPGHNAAQTVIADLDGKAIPNSRPTAQEKGPSLLDRVMALGARPQIDHTLARRRAFLAFPLLALPLRYTSCYIS